MPNEKRTVESVIRDALAQTPPLLPGTEGEPVTIHDAYAAGDALQLDELDQPLERHPSGVLKGGQAIITWMSDDGCQLHTGTTEWTAEDFLDEDEQ